MRRTIHPVVLMVTAGISAAALGCSSSDEPRAETVAQMLVERPAARLVLSPMLLARLKERAASGDAAWTALKKRCDDYTTGTFYAPNGNAYPSYPNVGQGYQGEEYPPVVRALGLCYRTSNDAAEQSRYGAAGARLLDAMSTPVGSGGQSPSTDSGYGIRNYVVGMAFGFDWLYPALSAATKSRVVSSMNTWIDWYDQSGFIKDDPIGNYFAGYFLAKTTAALATEGENSKAETYFHDVVTRMWGTLVKPSFTRDMAGGGWPEGWGYGRKAVLSMAEALWSVKTAKNLDWWSELPLANDEVRYVMHFAWPSLAHMDDQGTIRSGVNLRPSSELMNGLATLLEATGDAAPAALARGFAADVVGTLGDDSAHWSKFLYGETATPKTAVTTAGLSHFAPGPGHVAARSSWDKGAAWGALSGGAYINADYSGEQLFNAGGVSIVVGDEPLLLNPTGYLPQNGGTAGEDLVYDDSYGSRERRLYNTFFVNDASNPFNPGQNSFPPESSSAHVERYEDRGTFVHARAAGLEDQYGSSSAHPVSAFTRDFVFVRPGTFVLYDRTTVASASADQWLSFHVPVAPRAVSASDGTQRRFDVGELGSVRTLLPKSATTTTTTLPASVTRIEVHAPARAASQTWLSVISAGAGSGEPVRLSADDGNVASGNMVGVELGAPQRVVLFPSAHGASASVTSVEYSVAQAAGEHVLVDVEPAGTGYAVAATASAGKWRIQVSAGGPFQASPQKTLSFAIAADGSVAPGSSSPPDSTPDDPIPPDPTTPDPTTPPPDPTTPDSEPPTPPDPTTTSTVTFTQDVDGYGGVEDSSISNLSYSSSNPTGTVYKTNDKLYTYTLDYTTKALIRFDVSSIPENAVVASATLSVTAESWVSSQSLIGYFLATPWNQGGSGFGWTSTGTGSAWKTPGIGDADLVGPRFLVSGIDASGYQRKSTELSPTIVEGWLRDPSSNQGLVLTNPNTNRILRLRSSETKNAADRPTLSVTYSN